MRIELEQVSKQFRREWVLRKVNLLFEPGEQYAISGPNGSGKSTLLKIISGHLTPSRGKVRYSIPPKSLGIEEVYRHLSYAAPYIDLIEEFTLEEVIRFHFRFKKMHPDLDQGALIELLGFKKYQQKTIRNFSSGMKQRLKLLLALSTQSSLLILDEPTSNLDQQGVTWYRDLVQRFAPGRLLIVASNVEVDFDFCKHRIQILDWK